MSFRKLAFPNASFDGIWCAFSLSCEPKRNAAAVLQEMKRVLAPGGLLYIAMSMHGESREEEPYADASGFECAHHSLYMPGEMARLICESGMRCEEPILCYQFGSMSFVA